MNPPICRSFSDQFNAHNILILQKCLIDCREIWSQRRWVMDDLANDCFHLSRSQGMSDLGEIRGNYDTMLILREAAPSSRPYVATQIVIWMSQDGVFWFEFQINVGRGNRWVQRSTLDWGQNLWLSINRSNTRVYRLLVLTFVIASSYLRGRHFERFVAF